MHQQLGGYIRKNDQKSIPFMKIKQNRYHSFSKASKHQTDKTKETEKNQSKSRTAC